jgi:hypothetical protein
MAISRTTARRLCTKPEFELVEASFAPHVKTLSPARLRQKVARTRRLRDKYRDLARRQRLEARGKRSPQRARPAQGHDNTDRKATLFQEVLDRFEAQLGRAEAAPGRATAEAREKGSGTSGRIGAKTAGKNTGAARTSAGKTGAKKAGTKRTGATATGAAATGTKPSGPAAGKARAERPAKAGASAMKGARRKPERGPQDADQLARGRTARAHTRSSNARSQRRRDGRG